MCGLRPAAADFFQQRQAGLRAGISAAHVDAEHQVDALHRCVQRAGERDGAGVVDENIDAAKARGGFSHRFPDGRLVTDIALQGQGVTAGFFDLRRRRVDGAGEFRVGVDCLGRDRDVGAVARRAQRDGQADAARAADMNSVLPRSDITEIPD